LRSSRFQGKKKREGFSSCAGKGGKSALRADHLNPYVRKRRNNNNVGGRKEGREAGSVDALACHAWAEGGKKTGDTQKRSPTPFNLGRPQ